MIECKQSQIQQFFQIQGQITLDVASICPIVELIQDLMGIYIVAKFCTDWSIFAGANKMANFLIHGQTTHTVLVRLLPLSNSSEILWSYKF